MPKRGKKYTSAAKKVDRMREYPLEEAIELLREVSISKFVGAAEFHGVLNLKKGQDARTVKVDLTFPHQFRDADVRVAVAVPVDLKEKAKESGADIYDFEQIKKQIESGKIEFDVLLAVPQVMPELAKYGKELGPKGLMPNARNGTIIDNISKLPEVVKEFKQGKITIKADKGGVLHFAFGKVDMPVDQLKANLDLALTEVSKLLGKPKDRLFKRVFISPTMGPSIKVNLKTL